MDETLQSLQEIFSNPVTAAWYTFGAIGTVIFNARFYVQWYASEKKKQSVVPVSFWYLSSIGAIILLLFSFYLRSPNGGLSYSLNTVIYSRNLVFIWRDKGTLTRTRSIVFQSIVAVISVAAVAAVAWIWWHKIGVTKTKPQHEAVSMWLWIAVGVMGQGLFASRFIVQWIAAELRRKSIVPDVFWYISLAATALLSSSFAAQGEWLFAIGPLLNVPVYVRNIWLIHRGAGSAQTSGAV